MPSPTRFRHVLPSTEIIRRLDTTAPPLYSVGDEVCRIDLPPGEFNRYLVEAIHPPGTFVPPSRFPLNPRLRGSWMTTGRQVSFTNGRGYWLSARMVSVNAPYEGDTPQETPRPKPPPTNHKIGVPKNKLP